MCLGIPGRVVSMVEDNDLLAMVDVAGTERPINLGLLDEESGVGPGDWILIHMGFALQQIDEQEAAIALEGLQVAGGAVPNDPAFNSPQG
jgi:hydrogenase expression/formation protein HypC